MDDQKVLGYNGTLIRQLDEATEIIVDATPNKFNLEGIIVEWDPYFWMPFNQKFGLNDEDWQLIEKRVQAMNVHQTRTMVLPNYHEPMNDDSDPFSNNMDGFDFETDNMKALRRQLDLCERNGITVTLSYHGIPPNHWLAYPGMKGWSGANNNDEYAENVTALLRHLLIDQKYTCIRNLNLFNEPNICYGTLDTDFSVNQWTKGEPEKKEYIRMVETVNARLIKEKLRDKIRLIINDESENLEYMKDIAQKLGHVGDIVSSHNYEFTADSSKKTITEWAEKLVSYTYGVAPLLPHVLYELGNKNILDPYHVTDADSFERGFYLPCVVLTYLNLGGTGASYWILFDQLYGDGEKNQAMNMGLFAFKDENWKIRPTYHAWSLMSRFTEPGAEIHQTATNDDQIISTTVVNPDNSRSYLIINKQKKGKRIRIDDSGISEGSFEKYEYTRDNCMSQSMALPSTGTIKLTDGLLEDIVKPESFTVYHCRK